MTNEASRAYVLLVDKPVGPTSHDVVAQARRVLRTKRIGHTGTLDPFASGVLMLCVNRATRIAEYLSGLRKSYHAVARLDGFTDTDDHTGRFVERSEAWRTLTRSAVEDAFAQIQTHEEQVPPAYSAKKIQGERAYDLARTGVTLELAPVSVNITDLGIVRFAPPEVEFTMSCSSGTYVRALARDLGRILGTGAYLTELRRTRIGDWSVDDAVVLDELADEAKRNRATVELEDALTFLPAFNATADEVRRLVHGQAISAGENLPAGETVRALADGKLIALLRRSGNQLHPHKVIATAE